MKLLALVAVLAAPGVARADDERALSASAGYGTFSVPGEAMDNMAPPSLSPTIGGALGLTYEHMLGTDVGLRGELVGTGFYGGAQGEQSAGSFALLADAGVTFRFDVLRYVPYAFAGAGLVASTGGPISRDPDFVLVVGGGLDWLANRSRSYGGELRLASFGGDITVVTLCARATIRWGFF